MIVRFALLLAFLFLSTPAFAQLDPANAVGTIAEVEGAAIMVRGSGILQKTPLVVNEPVYLNDTIETGGGTKVHILFNDDTEITLGENALLSIDGYVYDPANTATSMGRFSFLRGAFVFASGLINKTAKPDLELTTAYGSIGMRGTTVWGGETDGQYGVIVLDGSASVATNRGRVILNAGDGTDLFDRNKAPGKPKKWGQPRVEKATATIALKNQEAVKARVASIREKRKAKIENRIEKKEELKEKIQEKRGDIIEKRETQKAAVIEKRQEVRENAQQKVQQRPQQQNRQNLQQKLQQRRNGFD